MKLLHKIFLVNFLTSLVFFVLIIIAGRSLAVLKFRDLEAMIEKDMVPAIAETLSREYTQQGDWHRFRHDPHVFLHLVLSVFDKNGFFRNQPPPPLRPWGHEFVSPRGKPVLLHERLALFDADQVKVAGLDLPEGPAYAMYPIVCHDKISGYVGFKRGGWGHELFKRFLDRRMVKFYGTGVVMFLFSSGIVSYFLSQSMLSPVAKLTQGTRALTQLHFQTRIQVRTKDELGRLATDFNHMAETLEAYEALRQQWVRGIFHEIKTPLTILQGEIEALQDGIRQLDQNRIDSLHSEVLYIETLVNDLHILSSVYTDTFEMEPVPMSPVELLDSLIDRLDLRLEKEKLTVTRKLSHKTCLVNADDARLRQVFLNVLENNIKHTSKPGTITIADSIHENDLVINIEDSGPGVPTQSLSKIFDRLYRVDSSRKSRHKGSGIGLSICKAIVSAHKGEILATLNEAGGLKIEIRLPLHTSDEKQYIPLGKNE